MSDKMERWDFTDNENGCDAMVLSEDGEFVEYEVAMRRIRELERQLDDRDAAWERAVRLAVLHLILFGTGAECDEDENTLAAIEKKVEDFMGLLRTARGLKDAQ